jgi:predicted DNA binding protein
MAPNGTSVDRASFETRSTELLRARLAIDVHPDSHFGVVSESGDAEVLIHQLKVDPRAGGTPSADLARDGECHSVLFYPEAERQEYVVTAATDRCVSTVFVTERCLADPESISDGVVTVQVVVPSRESFKRILTLLEECGADVSVEWLLNGEQRRLPAETEVTQITEKQREAIETALEQGYYENPRQASLSDLADELGVTDSAVSQRLGAAETKLVKSMFES